MGKRFFASIGRKCYRCLKTYCLFYLLWRRSLGIDDGSFFDDQSVAGFCRIDDKRHRLRNESWCSHHQRGNSWKTGNLFTYVISDSFYLWSCLYDDFTGFADSGRLCRHWFIMLPSLCRIQKNYEARSNIMWASSLALNHILTVGIGGACLVILLSMNYLLIMILRMDRDWLSSHRLEWSRF